MHRRNDSGQRTFDLFIPTKNESVLWERRTTRSRPIFQETSPERPEPLPPIVRPDVASPALLPPALIHALSSPSVKRRQAEQELSTKRQCIRANDNPSETASQQKYIPHRPRRIIVRIGRVSHDAQYIDPESDAKDEEFMERYLETTMIHKVFLPIFWR